MRNSKFALMVVFFLLFLIGANVYASKKPIQKGEPFPEIKLPVPKDPSYQKYLGVSGEGTFRIQDIKTEVVVIHIFHSG